MVVHHRGAECHAKQTAVFKVKVAMRSYWFGFVHCTGHYWSFSTRFEYIQNMTASAISSELFFLQPNLVFMVDRHKTKYPVNISNYCVQVKVAAKVQTFM